MVGGHKTSERASSERGRQQAFTQGYLGAMNTCPSVSKLFGSRDSKSATERGRLSGKSRKQSSGGVVGGGGGWDLGQQQLFFSGAGRNAEGSYHSNTEES